MRSRSETSRDTAVLSADDAKQQAVRSAFGSSNQLHALTTVGQFGAIAGLVLAGFVRGDRMNVYAPERVAFPS